MKVSGLSEDIFDRDLLKLIEANNDFAEYEKITASSGAGIQIYPRDVEGGVQYPIGLVVNDKDARCLLGTLF